MIGRRVRPQAWAAAAAAAIACAPAPLLAAAGGTLGGGQDLSVSLGRIVAALLICITVAALAVLLIRQRSGKIDLRALLARVELRPRAIEVLETRRLSLHADICLLRHDRREYLLLLMAGDARVLHEAEVGAAPAPAPASSLAGGPDRR